MFRLIVICASILLISVDGMPSEDNKQAISSQSYHRDDVPLSYKHTQVHDSRTLSQPEYSHQQNPEYTRPKILQYAPLPIKEKLQETTSTEETPEQHSFKSPQDKFNKEYLEPRPKAPNNEVHEKYHWLPQLSGHNIEMVQPTSYGSTYNDVYRKHRQPSKTFLKKYVVHQSPEQPLSTVRPENIRTTDQTTPTENHDTRGPAPNLLHPVRVFAPHYEPRHGKPVNPKTPKLHLNVARTYGFAYIPHKALKPNNMERPPSHTQAYYVPRTKPKKTMLYPVQGKNKNYPIYT